MPSKTKKGAGPNPPSRSPEEQSTIEATRPDGSGGGFLTRTQRNQAAFIKGITARCGCGDVESCKDCNAHAWSSQLLNADSGVSTEH